MGRAKSKNKKPDKKPDKKTDKYRRILEAAVKVFARHGFFQSTVAQVAKEAGVADGTIYLYFKNKDDILVQFFNYKTEQVLGRFRKEVEKAGNAKEKLKRLIRCHLEEFQQDMNMAVVYQAGTRQTHHKLVEDLIKDLTRTYLGLVGEIVEKGQEEGTMRKDLYMGLVKRFILGAVDEVINTWVLSGGKYDLTSMADPLVDLYLRGIGHHDS
jgi:TetR/AcrR family fatty acid metabolism transcriptional regulator